MADEKFKNNYVKNLSKYNEWFEIHKHEEDEDFKNLFNKELKSTNNIFDSTKKLSKYANDNLI